MLLLPMKASELRKVKFLVNDTVIICELPFIVPK